MMNKSTLLIAILMLGIGLGAGYWLSGNDSSTTAVTKQEKNPLFYRNPMNPTITSPVPAKDSMGMDYIPVYADEDKQSSERKIVFYRNPMNPSVTSPVPAKDSMGMDYVPVYADNEQGGEASEVAGTVKIDPVVVQNIGVRTAIAKRESISRTIRAVGRVDFDEERMARLHPKVEGWIEEIRVDKTGQNVAKDDILLSIYSPKLVSTQQEYLLALNNLSALSKSQFDEIRQGAADLVKSSRERLKLLDVSEHQIQELEQTRKVKKSMHIHSPVAGTVIRIGSRQGQFVTPKTELYMMVDLSQVWVYADVYEYELPWVKIDDEVEMTLASVPGKTFKGSLAYIYPYAEAKTRTTKVRLVFDNRDLLLRPNMFAEVSIQSDTLENAIVVPAESVIRSGGRTQVFVIRGPGKFEPRIVKLGIESNGQVAVLEGVSAGEEVVTSAQFLVDSESKLREATAKMMDALQGSETVPEEIPKGMDNHKGMSHGNEEKIDHSQMQMDNSTQGSETVPEEIPKGMDNHKGMSHGNEEKIDHSQMQMDNSTQGSETVPEEIPKGMDNHKGMSHGNEEKIDHSQMQMDNSTQGSETVPEEIPKGMDNHKGMSHGNEEKIDHSQMQMDNSTQGSETVPEEIPKGMDNHKGMSHGNEEKIDHSQMQMDNSTQGSETVSEEIPKGMDNHKGMSHGNEEKIDHSQMQMDNSTQGSETVPEEIPKGMDNHKGMSRRRLTATRRRLIIPRECRSQMQMDNSTQGSETVPEEIPKGMDNHKGMSHGNEEKIDHSQMQMNNSTQGSETVPEEIPKGMDNHKGMSHGNEEKIDHSQMQIDNSTQGTHNHD